MAYIPVSQRGGQEKPATTTGNSTRKGYVPVSERIKAAAPKKNLLAIETEATPILQEASLPPLPKAPKPVGDVISQGPKKTLMDRFRESEVGQALFGRGQEVDIAGNLKEDTGAIGFFAPSLNRSNFGKVTQVLDDLKAAGVDEKRANEIALAYADDPNALPQEKKTPQEKLAGMTLSDKERSVLRNRRLKDAVNLALDLPVGGGFAVGTIRRKGLKIAEDSIEDPVTQILRTEQDADLRRTLSGLRKVLPEFKDADEFSRVYEIASRGGREATAGLPAREAELVAKVLDNKADSLNFREIGKATGNDYQDEFGRDFFDQWSARASEMKAAIPSPTKDITPNTPPPPKKSIPEGKGSGRVLSEDESLEALARQVDNGKVARETDDIYTAPKGVSDTKAARGSIAKEGEKVDEARLALELEEQGLEQNRARMLARFARKTGEEAGTLPEVTGKGKSIFSRKGDDIANELGFADSEEARAQYVKYLAQKEKYEKSRASVRERVADYRDRKAVLEALRKEVNAEAISRNGKIRIVQDFFKLSDEDLAAVIRQTKFGNVKLMSEAEFNQFMHALEAKAVQNYELGKLRLQLNATIFNRELKKVENLREVLKFPKIENMSSGQLRKFNSILNTFRHGDEFLTVRQLQTLKFTDLSNIKTVREALENLAKEAGVPISKLEPEFKGSEMHKFKYDTSLARQHPLFDVMVTEKNRAFLEAQGNFVRLKHRMNELIGDARKSRRRGILDRLIPTDKRIFEWLEADWVEKSRLARDMTEEELKAAKYIQNLYANVRDYLIQMDVLKKYKSDYITHIRRGFLEAWREDGLMPGFKELFDQYKNDEAVFNILNSKTGSILPLEKFFQFSMRRTGALTPTKNVSRAVLAYMSTFERKRALDSLVPKIEIYAHSLTPRKLTPRGLEFDDRLKSFVKEWLNTKKGRPARVLADPGGKIDWALRSATALTRIIDLGFNIPGGIAANVGEQTLTAGLLGPRGYARGVRRLATRRGRRIVRKYENFVGETVWSKMTDTSNGIGDKFMAGMFGLFSVASRKANEIYLLSQMSKQEFKAGEIGARRLARLQKELGRYRVIEGSKSIAGSTAEGQVASQYRTWAVPIISSTITNLSKVQKVVEKGGIKALARDKELRDFLRVALTTAVIGTTLYQLGSEIRKKKAKDRTFTDEIILKAGRDSLTLIGALDPAFFTSEPRLVAFLGELGKGLKQMILLERHKTGEKKGTFKGDDTIRNTVTPRVIKQGASAVEDAVEDNNRGPSLPDLPKLPKPPKPPKLNLPELPKLPKFQR